MLTVWTQGQCIRIIAVFWSLEWPNFYQMLSLASLCIRWESAFEFTECLVFPKYFHKLLNQIKRVKFGSSHATFGTRLPVLCKILDLCLRKIGQLIYIKDINAGKIFLVETGWMNQQPPAWQESKIWGLIAAVCDSAPAGNSSTILARTGSMQVSAIRQKKRC